MKSAQKYDLYSAEFRACTHETFAQMRADDPVLQQPGLDGKTPIWFVTSYAEVEQILLNDHLFVRNPALISPEMAAAYSNPNNKLDAMVSNHMLNHEGKTHQRLRSLVSKAFTPKVVRDLRPRIEAIANQLLDKVIDNGRMELISDFAFPLPITVIAELLGIPLDRQDNFRLWSNVFVSPALTAAAQQEYMHLMQEFATYMQALVTERRQRPGDDLLSRLIHVEEQGDHLNENELFSMLTLLIVAGHETTVSFIGNAVWALLQHRPSWEALQADPSMIPTALEELLRYDSPVERALTRFVVQDVEIGGGQMRKGDLVIVILGSANRDETRFACPAELDITRVVNPHLAFGKGVHYCLGAPLARLEGQIALRTLLTRCPDLELDIDTAALKWRDVPLFRSLTQLPVKWGNKSA